MIEPKEPLDEVARRVRRHVVTMAHGSCGPHVGSNLSCVDILVALYFGALRVDPDWPEDVERDRFVLDKGTGTAALYAVLAERGFFSPDRLCGYALPESGLPQLPHLRVTPGVDASTGSLAQGFSVAAGMAFAASIWGRSYRTFCLLSDGGCQEGEVWEAAATVAGLNLSSLAAIVDDNGWQACSRTREVVGVARLVERWAAFGWSAREIDGHDVHALLDAFEDVPDGTGRPVAIIARTIKGKGVSFMEDDNRWHYDAPTDAELMAALKELEAS